MSELIYMQNENEEEIPLISKSNLALLIAFFDIMSIFALILAYRIILYM